MNLEDIKYESLTIDKKQIIIVRFDFEYPMAERDIQQITQSISNIINQDRRFLNRVIFLPKGFELDSLNEEDFVQIWKSKSDKEFVDEIIDENKNPNQQELFQEVIENE
tara:strand:- start:391 stop:717 length:327 start_codon:yes stop_codon:yes gene_type:complete